MLTCPHCAQKVATDAVSCPSCRKQLKAFGHQGMPLHYATQDEFLCDRCLYHHDDTCTFPQRPYAKTCTLYQNLDNPPETEVPTSRGFTWKYYYHRYQGLFWLGILLIVSLLLALNVS